MAKPRLGRSLRVTDLERAEGIGGQVILDQLLADGWHIVNYGKESGLDVSLYYLERKAAPDRDPAVEAAIQDALRKQIDNRTDAEIAMDGAFDAVTARDITEGTPGDINGVLDLGPADPGDPEEFPADAPGFDSWN